MKIYLRFSNNKKYEQLIIKNDLNAIVINNNVINNITLDYKKYIMCKDKLNVLYIFYINVSITIYFLSHNDSC